MRRLLFLLPALSVFAFAGAASAQVPPKAEGGTIMGEPPPTSRSVKPVGVDGSFVNRLDATFGRERPGATIRSKRDLDRVAYYRYIYGDATTTGNGTDGLYGNYRSRHRDYPDGDPRSLHVIGDKGLTLKAHCGLETGIRSDCSDGHIESGIMRFALPVRPGSYIEIRCGMPSAMYAWPAFWLNPGQEFPPARTGLKPTFSALRWPPEIDIFDQFGYNNMQPGHYLIDGTSTDNHDAAFGNPHDNFMDPGWGGKAYYTTPQDLTAGQHVYGLDWGRDNTLRFYLDGKLIRDRYYEWNSIDHVPAHLLASLQVGAKFNDLSKLTDQGGKPDGWDWTIDYIRVWDRTGPPG